MFIYCSTLLSLCSLHIHNNKYKNIFLLIQLLCIYLYTEDYIINNKYVVYKHLYAQHPSKPILAPPAPPLPPPSPKSPGFCYSNVGRYVHGSCTVCAHHDTFWPGYIMFTEKLFLPPGSCLKNRNSSCISFWSTNHKKLKAERRLTRSEE